MIRVLHVLDGLHAGGMETMVMNYYRKINKNNIQFDFLLFSDESFYDSEALSYGANIYRLTPRRKNPIRNYYELNKFFSTHSYEVVHVHQGINYFAPLKYAKKYNVPIRIAHSHGMDPKLIRRQGILYKFFTVPKIKSLANQFVACSESAAKQIFSKDIIKNKDYFLLQNSIDYNLFIPNVYMRKSIRKDLNIEDSLVIGHVGNFTYPKNHELIISIFEEIHNLVPQSTLVLIGIGPNYDQILKLVKIKNLEANVKFLGLKRDVFNYLQSFDRFLFPSIYEGLPLSLVEAQIANIPTFASSTITRDVQISTKIKFIDLSIEPKEWAEQVIKGTNTTNSQLDSSYDINKNVIDLEKYYMQLTKKNVLQK